MKGVAHYCYGELPPLHMCDGKGMIVGRMHPDLRTPGNLLHALPKLKPAAENLLVPTQHEGHYTIAAHGELVQFETCNWDPLYHIPKVKEHGSAEASVAHSRANAGRTREVSHPGEEPLLLMEC